MISDFLDDIYGHLNDELSGFFQGERVFSNLSEDLGLQLKSPLYEVTFLRINTRALYVAGLRRDWGKNGNF